ncbi:unnamed protein product [Paramecium pentaurelia]|uniref:Uncharacterized protein n=1 Tax=Paramecium pentaurelia TaxID=43138 RepID=A0A8S1V463_9CILI|nr:unnamed protein product [Paramecium pentaurelia]
MKQVISILLIIVISNAISQTLYEQCYSTWGKDQLGTRKNTIFSAGYLKFSVAMMLHTYGVQPMEQKFLENCILDQRIKVDMLLEINLSGLQLISLDSIIKESSQLHNLK